MTQDQLKQAVAQAAVDFILPKLDDKSIVGVGTGSTANCFIDALALHKGAFDGAVASSEATAARLKGHGIPVYELNTVSDLEFYVDGADESDENLNLIKGGGAALTREKIVAAVAKTFICIADASKLVPVLGAFPLPVEVIPMARSHVARELVKLGGDPVYREGVISKSRAAAMAVTTGCATSLRNWAIRIRSTACGLALATRASPVWFQISSWVVRHAPNRKNSMPASTLPSACCRISSPVNGTAR